MQAPMNRGIKSTDLATTLPKVCKIILSHFTCIREAQSSRSHAQDAGAGHHVPDLIRSQTSVPILPETSRGRSKHRSRCQRCQAEVKSKASLSHAPESEDTRSSHVATRRRQMINPELPYLGCTWLLSESRSRRARQDFLPQRSLQ